MNPKERTVFDCIDGYTAGNPVRLVKGPKPLLVGENMKLMSSKNKVSYFLKH